MGQIVGQKLRIKNKLTSLALKKITQPGRYSDGNNLYLKVEETGSRRWILRLSINGKRRDMGLGSFSFINLNDARELAHKYNKLAKSGTYIFEDKKQSFFTLYISSQFVRDLIRYNLFTRHFLCILTKSIFRI